MIETFIRRRVGTTMLFLGICLVGCIAAWRLPVQLLPDLEFPTLTIVTPYEGSPPSEVEQLVTRRIEEAAGSVGGVREIRSESLEGLSLVTVRFNWKTDMSFAQIEAREKVDIVKGALPEDAGRSVVVKYDPGAEPVMICAVEAKKGDFRKLRKRVERDVIPLLERADGVALVEASGGFTRQINVGLENGRLHAHGLSIHEIIRSIGEANCSFPAGSIEKGDREYTVRTVGEFSRVREIGRVVVGRNGSGVPVYLEDAASVEDGYRERKCIIRLDGKEAVGLLVHREPGKNCIATCGKVREMIGMIEKKFGGEISIRTVYDQSEFIRNSIDNVYYAALLGAAFAILVLWFFLGDPRLALIIAVSIPVSVLGAFALMYFSGLSLNVMTMGGLALGTGMMVDAGIVVLESISLKTAECPDARGAVRVKLIVEGVREVTASVISAVATTLVVFLPILFLSGITGALFGQLALTITYSLSCSLLVALLLLPMLAALPRRIPPAGARRSAAGNGWSARGLMALYERVLDCIMLDGRKLLGVCAVAVLSGIGATAVLDRELMPKVDTGGFSIEIHAAPGTPLADTSSICAGIESKLLSLPYVRHVYTKIGSDHEENIAERLLGKGSNYALVRVMLRPGRREGTRGIIQRLKNEIRTGESVKVEFKMKEDIVETVLGAQPGRLSVELCGGDTGALAAAGERLKARLAAIGGISNIATSMDRGNPEFRIAVDRARMHSLGVTVAAVATTVRAAVHGEIATIYRESDDEVDVRVRLDESGRSGIAALGAIAVKSDRDALLPLGKFVSIEEGYGTARIARSNQGRVNIITGDITGERDSIIARVSSLLREFGAADGIEARLSGELEEIGKTMPEIVFAVILAMVLVYMVMAAQFQSFIDPLIIMFSIPLTMLGASGALLLTGSTININSGLGIILLVGTVVDNAIVLIDCVIRLRKEGRGLEDAIRQAGRRRMRPIMMTTLTTVLGMLPLALGVGEGAELQQPLAIATIGGLSVSTLLTLVLIPAIYRLVHGARLASREEHFA